MPASVERSSFCSAAMMYWLMLVSSSATKIRMRSRLAASRIIADVAKSTSAKNSPS